MLIWFLARCIGVHEKEVSSVGYCGLYKTVVSGGWDSKIHLWSCQDSSRTEYHPVGKILAQGKVFCLHVRNNLIAAGLSEGTVGVWDVRHFSKPMKTSSVPDCLNLQCIAILPDGKVNKIKMLKIEIYKKKCALLYWLSLSNDFVANSVRDCGGEGISWEYWGEWRKSEAWFHLQTTCRQKYWNSASSKYSLVSRMS